MKKILFISSALVIASCSQPLENSNDSSDAVKMKELELKEKELELKEKELEASKGENNVSNNTESQESKNKEVKTNRDFQTDPVLVVEQIFTAAKSGNLASLSHLCDPNGENDGDTRNICSIASAPKDAQDDFIAFFKFGKVVGEASIAGDAAAVQIKFGYNGDKDETMKLIKRGTKWYLSSI